MTNEWRTWDQWYEVRDRNGDGERYENVLEAVHARDVLLRDQLQFGPFEILEFRTQMRGWEE